MNRMPLSTIKFRRRVASALPFLVLVIFQNGSEPQMGRIDTGGIVATRAIMQNAQTCRYWASVYQPTQTVGLNRTISKTSPAQQSVPFPCLISSPDPTTLGLLDEAPKSNNDGFGASLGCKRRVLMARKGIAPAFAFSPSVSKLGVHNQWFWLCRSRAVRSAPGHSLYQPVLAYQGAST